MTEWISPGEKRRREQAEREAAAEQLRRKGKPKEKSKDKPKPEDKEQTSNGADQQPPDQPPPPSEDDYGARPPHADCDPRSLENNGESIAAVIDILRNHPAWRGVLAFDRFSLHVTLRKPPPRSGPQIPPPRWTPQAMRDVDGTNALAWFHQLGLIKLKIGSLHSAMVAVATDNSFHPVLEWFDRICTGATPPERPSTLNKADPKLPKATTLDLWLTCGFGAADNVLTRAIARAFMIALVRRVRQPGCQQDYMLVLHSGEQGVLKSTGLRTLIGDDWFADGMPDIANKDAALQMTGKILVERGEVELLTKRDKAFISRTIDRFRPPYGRLPQDVPRTCSIAGTTNFATFINDPSGGRRYWPVEAGQGDRDWLGVNRDLIWRLACEAEARREAAWLNDAKTQTAVRSRQDDAQPASSWDDAVIRHAEKRGSGFAVDVGFISGALGIDADRVDPKKHDQAFAAILQRKGWRHGKGRKRYLWFRGDQLPLDDDEPS